ncbi:MAG: hypothetical protein HWD89_13990 [Tenacibaculum sp.]|uniref:hypothetical protein n=1 Tax=Tenacibaculum sp. TaxID=1906242 RepID=UPI001851E7AA|nr:hypothetical protein [Tenacibaculum sp.]NVK10160.1 hypothetical protein [Tenacibaculum sp.]
MKNIFENKKTLKYTDFIKQFFIVIPIALFWSLLINLITWSKPEVMDIVKFIIIFEFAIIIKIFIYTSRVKLDSIYIDYDNQILVINKFLGFNSCRKASLKLDELVVSKINHSPFTTFTLFVFFTIKDNQNQIKISSDGYGIKEEDIKQIYEELNTIPATIRCQ